MHARRSMEEQPLATAKPALQKPPGYRDPAAPAPAPARYPVRAQPLPPSLRSSNLKRGQQRPPRRCFRRRCCCIFLLILLLLFVVAIAGGLSYLWFQPKLLSFRLESIQIPKFNVTAKAGGSSLDAASELRIRITNPNKKINLSLAATRVLVYAVGDGDGGDVSLGSGSLPKLELERKNSTLMKVETKIKGAAVDEILGRRLSSQFRSKSLRVKVELRTKVMISHGGAVAAPVRILCDGVSLKQMDGGASPKCVINLFKTLW
ncbi:NDR1/HIN1-like protein 6 isoform X2 [Wolffia australiana]